MSNAHDAYEQSQAPRGFQEPDATESHSWARPDEGPQEASGAGGGPGDTDSDDVTQPEAAESAASAGAAEQPPEGGASETGASATTDADAGPADAGAPEGEDEVAQLRAALEETERQRDEYLDHLRRERAEFDNFRKRNARERLEAMDRGIQSLMTELLGVLDNFGHVLAAAEDSEDQALAKGAAMVHEELLGVLARFGLEDVPGEGTPFDPQWHEAMMQVEAGEENTEPTVAQVLRSGYRFKGRVLRPASVSVAQ